MNEETTDPGAAPETQTTGDLPVADLIQIIDDRLALALRGGVRPTPAPAIGEPIPLRQWAEEYIARQGFPVGEHLKDLLDEFDGAHIVYRHAEDQTDPDDVDHFLVFNRKRINRQPSFQHELLQGRTRIWPAFDPETKAAIPKLWVRPDVNPIGERVRRYSRDRIHKWGREYAQVQVRAAAPLDNVGGPRVPDPDFPE